MNNRHPGLKPFNYKLNASKSAVNNKFINQIPKNESLKCFCCGETAPTLLQLKEHIDRKHLAKRKEVPPNTGDYSTEEWQKLVDSKLKQCPVCDKLYQTPRRMRDHLLESHSSVKRYSCPYCDELFTTQGRCKRHVKFKHLNDNKIRMRKYECNYCQRKYSNKTCLAEHINGHTGVFVYACRFCDKFFLYKKSLFRHLEKHKVPSLDASNLNKIKCNFCNASFPFTYYLKNHIEEEHICIIESIGSTNYPRVVNSEREPSDFRGYTKEGYKQMVASKSSQCPVCSKIFKSPKYMREHLYSHSSKNQHMCDICGKLFKSVSYARIHRKEHLEFGKQKEKNFECDLCSRKYSSKTRLQEHIITHTGDKRHQCQICGTAYFHTRSLQRHEKRHKAESGENDMYTCPVCKKQFVEKYEMVRHRKHKHEGKCHVCKICGVTIKFNIARHMKSHSIKDGEFVASNITQLLF